MEENYKVEFEQTIKSYKDLNRKDLPLYTKKYDGEWLYRLRLHNETLIENVLRDDNKPSNRDEWRMNLHNLMKYFEENE